MSLLGEILFWHWWVAGVLLLIRPLMLLIIPLIFVSVVVGMTSIGDPSKLGVVGSSTVLYYLVTMLIAVTIGVVAVTTFRPGDLPDDVRTIGVAANDDAGHQSIHVVKVDELPRDSSEIRF